MSSNRNVVPVEGLSFSEARKVVIDTLKSSIASKTSSSAFLQSLNYEQIVYLLGFPALVVVLLVFTLVFDADYVSIGGLVFTILFVTCLAVINTLITYWSFVAKENEIYQELQQVCDDYLNSGVLDSATERKTNDDDVYTIVSGHPQISMVSCYRSKKWQRIPSLLLAPGDIIALQGGDTAPGNCFELSETVFHNSGLDSPTDVAPCDGGRRSAVVSSIGAVSHRGVEVDSENITVKGSKIFIRDRRMLKSSGNHHLPSTPSGTNMPANSRGSPAVNQPAANTPYSRHKSLAPESVELLLLSGDVRCFELVEAPMDDYIRGVLDAAEKRRCKATPQSWGTWIEIWCKVRSKGMIILGHDNRQSSLYILFVYTCVCGIVLLLVLSVLIVLAAIVRYSASSESRIRWADAITLPISSAMLSLIPISLPLFLLLTESFSVANLLAVTEVVVQSGEPGSTAATSGPSQRMDIATEDSQGVQRKRGSRALGSFRQVPSTPNDDLGAANTENVVDGSAADVEGDTESEGIALVSDSRRRNRDGSVGASSADFDGDAEPNGSDRSDEFLDEDIDERVEEAAQESSTHVLFSRRLEYFVACVSKRLGFRRSIPTPDSNVGDKCRQPLLPIPHEHESLLQFLGAVTMVCFVDDDVICEGVSATEEVFLLKSPTDNDEGGVVDQAEDAGKGLTLDLHASHNVSGSRFELPDWWKYLPNLKPIGLNAMLTYGAMAPLPDVSNHYSNTLVNTGAMNGNTSEGTTRHRAVSNSTGEYGVSCQAVSISSGDLTPSKRGMAPPEYTTSLVGHVRKTLPLDSMRRLSEDIGFVEADVSNFKKLLELNVMAPGLGDAKLLEDTHAWGQEEMRRRGMLMTQLRAAVVKDARSGSLQMMSQGDPALLLHYCAEYWDGQSISPFTSADRKEVMSAYERWQLEDFDVVAFAYTPIPTYLQSAVSDAYNQAQSQLDEIMSTNANVTDSYSTAESRRRVRRRYSQSNCVFIVDPFTGTHHRARQLGKRQIDSGTTGASQQLVVNNPSVSASDNSQSVNESVPISSLPSDSGMCLPVDSKKPFAEKVPEAVEIDPSFRSAKDGQDLSAVESQQPSIFSLAKPPELLDTGNGVASDYSFSISPVSTGTTPAMIVTIPPLDNPSSTSARRVAFQLGDENSRHESRSHDHELTTMEGVNGSFSPTIVRDRSSSLESSGLEPLNVLHEMDDIDADFQYADIGFVETDADDVVARRIQSEFAQYDLNSEDPVEGIRSPLEVNSILEFSGDSEPKASEDSFSGVPTGTSPLHFTEPLILKSRSDSDLVRVSDGFSGTSSQWRRSSPVSSSFQSTSMDDNNVRLKSSPSQNNLKSGSISPSVQMLRSGSSCSDLRGHADSSSPVMFNLSAGGISKPSLVSGATGTSRRTKSTSALNTSGSRAMANSDIEGGDDSGAHMQVANAKVRSVGACLWPYVRHQVFLGIAASSVPIKLDVSDLREDLTNAGVRFVYFSPRNMRRSKPVAEKIGIQFDWNCAISLRDLDGGEALDPHRAISSYGDWDFHAKMPHGVAAITKHLQEVDNVPLLVSLYTDATPTTINQMVQVFQDYGEVVLSVGSAYREQNQQIFDSSDVAVSVGCIPGDPRTIPAQLLTVLDRFPNRSETSLTKADLWLHFKLVGLSTVALLQHSGLPTCAASAPSIIPSLTSSELRLSALLDGIRTGRIFLLHAIQCIAACVVSCCCLACWSVVSLTIPISSPPYLTPNTSLMFVCVYLPLLLAAMMVGPAPHNVLKSTPRKNIFMRRDESKFIAHLIIRCLIVLLGTFAFAWIAKAAVFRAKDESWYSNMLHFTKLPSTASGDHSRGCTTNYWLLQDLVGCQVLLQIITQIAMLSERGLSLLSFPNPRTHPALWSAIILVLGIHAVFVTVRAEARAVHSNDVCIVSGAAAMSSVVGSDGVYAYAQVHWVVYLLLPLLPLCSAVVASWTNDADMKAYTRYLRFLRLEFDTRLGMHSPR